MLRTVMVGLLLVLFDVNSPRANAQFSPPAGTGPGLPETIEAIDSARVTTRILYITAHPDDESAAVLTYLARGLHADVALLSLTRGEGGQNDLGPEQAPQLGLIRTQELLAATRGYGVKLYFTRARDFGFSKTPEETEKIWGDEVLKDMVRVIRSFRPNVVINNFGGVHTGHGHHQTAGLWTPKAVQLAADKNYKLYPGCAACPEDESWGASGYPVILDLDRDSKGIGYLLPLDEVSPLWGKTWREIGLDAFANHRTQGITFFLGSPFLRRPISLVREDGVKFDSEMLARSLDALHEEGSLKTCGMDAESAKLLRQVDGSLSETRKQALNLQWKDAAVSVARAAQSLKGVHPDQKNVRPCIEHPDSLLRELNDAQARVDHAVQLVAGIEINGVADSGEIVLGEGFKVTVSARYRPGVDCSLAEPMLDLALGMKEKKREKDPKDGETILVDVSNFVKPTGWDIGQAEGLSLASVRQPVTVAGYSFEVEQPVTHVQSSSTRVDRVPLRIVPAYTLMVEPRQAVEVLAKKHVPFDVLLRVHSYATQAHQVSVGLDVPPGWTTTAPVEASFQGSGDKYAKLTVTPPVKISPGNFTIAAYAELGEDKFTTSLEPLPTLPTQLWTEPATCTVHAFAIAVPQNLRVGYITAESEPVPEALEQLGIHVEMLDAAALAFGDLSRFHAIVVGVRAYELRHDLPGANQRLLDYVSNGGTLVVQYERDFAWDRAQYAPYPSKISPAAGGPLPRITDENSPVTFLRPDDPLLNTPNKITIEDFKGWVQERGLYFWTQFDPKYTALLAMNDPGEPDQNGGLVYAHYGKGTYIYTGIAFFRQLPEGVPGAYRLFVNLLSGSHPGP
jgi:LmbE family N-acetylglucosaminyl deacetylase